MVPHFSFSTKGMTEIRNVEEIERNLAKVRYRLVLARIAYANAEGAEQTGHKADIKEIRKEEQVLTDSLRMAQRRRAWRITRSMGTGASRSPSKKNS